MSLSVRLLLLRSIVPRLSSPAMSTTTASPTPYLKKYFILNYKYVDNVVEKRAPIRGDHLAYVKTFTDDGRLVMGGPFANPVDGALVIFDVDEKQIVEQFAKNDPYVKGGIVTSWDVKEWTVVVERDSNKN